MKTYKKIRRTIKEINDVRCNKCGEFIYTVGFPDWLECFTIKDSFGFGSKYDGKSFELDICRDCLIKFMNKCKYNPLKEN